MDFLPSVAINAAFKKVIIKHNALEIVLMLYHQLILLPKRCGYLNSQLGFVWTNFSSVFKYVHLFNQSTQPCQCHDEHIYTSIPVIYRQTYFNKRHLFSVTIATLARCVIAELIVRVKSMQKIKSRLGLSTMRLSRPGLNWFSYPQQCLLLLRVARNCTISKPSSLTKKKRTWISWNKRPWPDCFVG